MMQCNIHANAGAALHNHLMLILLNLDVIDLTTYNFSMRYPAFTCDIYNDLDILHKTFYDQPKL